MELPDISKYINQKEILQQTLAGINRGFMQIGEQEIIAEQNEPTFETLINALCPVLENLYHNKHQLFQALMYKIDISEKMLNNAIEKPGKDLLKEVAVLVVKRELQKTISRNFYKKQH